MGPPFGQLEKDMDVMLAELFGVSHELMDEWINPGRYVSGTDLVNAGLAKMISVLDRDGKHGVIGAVGEEQPVEVGKPKLRKAP